MEGSEPTDEVTAGPPQRRHSRWIWVSALLALVAVGLTIWALTLRSDLDNAQQELDTTTQQLASTKQDLETTKKELATTQQDVDDLQSSQRRRTGVALVTGKVVYDEFAKQLGAAHDELAATQQDVEDANKAATQAEQDAAAAKQDAADAGTETDKAKAEAKQAKAESQAAQSRAEAAAGLRQGLHRGVRRVVRGRQRERPGRDRAQGPPERHRRLQGRARGRVARATRGLCAPRARPRQRSLAQRALTPDSRMTTATLMRTYVRGAPRIGIRPLPASAEDRQHGHHPQRRGRAAARRMGDALAVCVVIHRAEPDRFERAALRWLARTAHSQTKRSAWDAGPSLRPGALRVGALPVPLSQGLPLLRDPRFAGGHD